MSQAERRGKPVNMSLATFRDTGKAMTNCAAARVEGDD
jgi:hypothetical protein